MRIRLFRLRNLFVGVLINIISAYARSENGYGLEARSENGCGRWENFGLFWRTWRHPPTTNSQEYPPPRPRPRLPWIYEKPLQIHWSTPRMVKYHVGSLHRSLFFQPSVAFARVRYTLMFSLFYVYKITSFFPWNLLNIYLLALLHVYLNLSFD